ncbi:glycosyltransferase [Flexithrix dorotheae]|uniref:glycosyltransferase n=1 Tax=Flexithrix dorotheae TaxID=70993 RepID=UPI00047624B8|nr:glycosyltransferase family 2 protein [Flexithrix dorotheae]
MELISIVLLIYFSCSVLYVWIFTILGRINYRVKIDKTHLRARIAVFVPAYKEDAIMPSIANQLLVSNYPTDLYDVIIIADSFQKKTIEKLNKLPIKVVEVAWEESTKAKSLNYALELFEGQYDIAVISDADNIFEKDFLSKINNAYQNGYTVIQGCRVAKNLNTSFAILDGASEAINNHIFRRGANALGLSSALIGSGMAFDYALLKKELGKIEAIGGFDKELQLSLIKKGHHILYIEDAITYDEKIEKASSFGNQRRRWLSTQFIYLKRHFIPGFSELFKGNVSYFNLAILVNVFLSRVLTLGALCILTLVHTLFASYNIVVLWWGLLLIYGISLLISLPKRMYTKKTLLALLKLPQAFFIMFLSLLKIRGANKKFIHTVHTNTEVDNSAVL